MKRSEDEDLSSLKYAGALTGEKVAPLKWGIRDQ